MSEMERGGKMMIREYINYCIHNGAVLKIICPQLGCNRPKLEDNEISAIVTESVYKKYLKMKANKIVSMDNTLRFCIHPGKFE